MVNKLLSEYIRRYIQKKPYIKILGEKILRNKTLIIEESYNLLNTEITVKTKNCLINLINSLNETPPILISFEITKNTFGKKFFGDATYEIEMNIDLDIESLYGQILTVIFVIEQYEGNGNIKIDGNIIYPDRIFLDISNAINKKEYFEIYFDGDLKQIIVDYDSITIITTNFSQNIELTEFNREILSKEFKKLNNYIRNLSLL